MSGHSIAVSLLCGKGTARCMVLQTFMLKEVWHFFKTVALQYGDVFKIRKCEK